jgi:hypothetical protein
VEGVEAVGFAQPLDFLFARVYKIDPGDVSMRYRLYIEDTRRRTSGRYAFRTRARAGRRLGDDRLADIVWLLAVVAVAVGIAWLVLLCSRTRGARTCPIALLLHGSASPDRIFLL